MAVKMAVSGRTLAAEIAALGRIRHPNVPGLVAADREGTWFARAYVPGTRLTTWAHGRPLEDRLLAFVQLARALAAVHAAGVLHGDLSPANVLVDENGAPHLVDLGSDTRGGSLGWMAPERFRGDPPSVAADLYGLGALLYALCTGRPPYERTGSLALGYSAAASLPLPPTGHVPELATSLEDTVLACLTWTAGARPRSALDVAIAVETARPVVTRAPLLGMREERERLRRLVVDALRGEQAFVLVHGAPGSGRAALLAEMARGARREGLRVQTMGLAAARQALVLASERDAIFVDAGEAGAEAVQREVDVRTEAAIVVVRCRFPVPALARKGAVHVRPPLLALADMEGLVQLAGLPPDRVARLAARSRGRPGVLMTLLGGQVPEGPPLDAVQERLVSRLEEGSASLQALAELVDLSDTATLDRLDPLFARGLVWSSPDGREVFASRGAL